MDEKFEKTKVTDLLKDTIENLKLLTIKNETLRNKLDGCAPTEVSSNNVENYNNRGVLSLSIEILERCNILVDLFDKEISKI